RARDTGLDFVHVNGMSGRFSMPEVIAPGVALFDYDQDGDLDVYLVQGQPLGPGAPASRGGTPLTDRLYRNDLRVEADGTRRLRFTDVTAQSGIDAHGYGMGVAVGDIDNDGRPDLYLTKFDAPNQLFRNNGNGTFTDVSKRSGTDTTSWSVSASFVDIDRDGWLDLYVGHYLRYTLEGNTRCMSPSGAADYCTPDSYQALPDRLYRNQRDGTFADVSARSQISRAFGPALGVSTADVNADGWMDIYVANDGQENQLWVNRRDGTFENRALLAGVALPLTGKAEASMGVDAGDFDGDGDDDLVVTELTGEGTNVFVNDGAGLFEDVSTRTGIGPASTGLTGFGTAWFDYDNDGRLDLLAVNGTVQVIEALRQAGDPFPVHQRKTLFHNTGAGRFDDVSARAGAVFALSEVGRGAAFGDVDNDGDIDVLVGNNNGPVRLLVNQAASGAHWVGLRLVGAGGRDQVGARVRVTTAGTVRSRRARADGSFASANDPRVHVGLGASAAPSDVTVDWPDGRRETFAAVPADRYTTLTEGTGK
ncbi:MAG TPA: CRTAC1 family protein, partial [Vicinamibacterales bacterium]|nr:CRTAC1 family protein [Vicinamibacterales bacterium]